jgi:hypothetical protein
VSVLRRDKIITSFRPVLSSSKGAAAAAQRLLQTTIGEPEA